VQDLTDVAKTRQKIYQLGSQVDADYFPELKRSMRPLFQALLQQYKVDNEEIKAQVQFPDDLEANFLERSKATQVDKAYLPLKLPQQSSRQQRIS